MGCKAEASDELNEHAFNGGHEALHPGAIPSIIRRLTGQEATEYACNIRMGTAHG